jgi:hypothetical protein
MDPAGVEVRSMTALDEFMRHVRYVSADEVNHRLGKVIGGDPRVATGRMDEAAQGLEHQTSLWVAYSLPLRRKRLDAASTCLSSAWLYGFWYGRIVFDSENTDLRYSASDEEAVGNAERLAVFVEELDLQPFYKICGEVVLLMAVVFERGPMYRPLLKRLGVELGRSMLVTVFLYGVAAAIGERQIFVDSTA